MKHRNISRPVQALALASIAAASAQGAIIVSNLGEISAGSLGVGFSEHATSFTTGLSGGTLNGISILVEEPGSTIQFTGSIWSSSSGTPGAQQFSLGSSSPTTGGTGNYVPLLFTPPTPVSLSANTQYFLVLTGNDGDALVSTTTSANQTGSAGWSIGDDLHINATPWGLGEAGRAIRFSVDFTAVPEPAETAGVLAAGLVGFALWRRRARP